MTRNELVERILDRMMRDVMVPLPDDLFFVSWCRQTMLPLARDLAASNAPYLPVAGGKAIMCFTCGLVSRNPNDVTQRYCPSCHVFHDDHKPPVES